MKKILFLICLFNAMIYGNEFIKINDIMYYGDFHSQNYIKEYNVVNGFYQNHGEIKKIKLPAKIDNWPANEIFDDAPEVVIVNVEIENTGEKIINDLILEVKLRYKISKIIYDENGDMDIEKSEKNQNWENYFVKKEIKIKKLNPKTKNIIKVGQFNVYDDLEKYDKIDMKPWLCQTEVSVKDRNIKLIKDFQIDFVW